MKKLVIPISILSLVAVGIILSLPKDEVETENTQIVQTQNKEEIENKNTNQNHSKNKGGEDEKIIINTITGENVPEGFYDEELVDGYTYNNPKPFDISIVTPNENPDVPGYITEDQMKNLSESWLVPSYPFEEYTGDHNHKYMDGTNYHELKIDFPYSNELVKMNGKEAFTEWFKSKYGYDFVFVQPMNYTTSSKLNKYRYWNILIIGESLHTVKLLSSNFEREFPAGIRNSRYNLPKYRGTELEEIARKKVQEFIELSEN